MTLGSPLRCSSGRPLVPIICFLFILSSLGLAPPIRAASFATFAGTQTFNFCNTSLVGGGNFDGTGLASSVAPTATTLGSCTLGPVDAMADASALLGTGQLHIYATASGQASAFASASMADTLTLNPPGGFVNATFPVTFTMTLSGTLTGNSQASATLSATSTVATQKSVLTLCSGGLVAVGCGSGNQVSVTVDVLTTAPVVGFSELLNGYGRNCVSSYQDCYPTLLGTADYAHTAQLSIQLPPGFTFTSGSGVLLTQVPEPPEDPLLAMAFGLLGLERAGRNRIRPQRRRDC